MKYPTVFNLISGVFENQKVSAVLIGGFAVNYYKVMRQTADIDFLITKEDFDKILSILEEEGYITDYTQELFAKLSADKAHFMDIDFMCVDKDTFDKIIKHGKEITIAKARFIVPSLNHLIALKLHSLKFNPKLREYRDFPDIIELVRVNNIDVKDEDFKELCLKFGTKELYEKMLHKV